MSEKLTPRTAQEIISSICADASEVINATEDSCASANKIIKSLERQIDLTTQLLFHGIQTQTAREMDLDILQGLAGLKKGTVKLDELVLKIRLNLIKDKILLQADFDDLASKTETPSDNVDEK